MVETLAELGERLIALRQLVDERDRLYKERDESRRTAVDAALAAVKEQTKSSFEASEKAIVKAEEAQKAYNASHNDLARKMDEQNKATIPRPEAQTRFDALEEKIASIKNTLAASSGVSVGGKALKDESRSNLAIAVSVIVLLITLGKMLLGK